jgi:hypothetical protein
VEVGGRWPISGVLRLAADRRCSGGVHWDWTPVSPRACGPLLWCLLFADWACLVLWPIPAAALEADVAGSKLGAGTGRRPGLGKKDEEWCVIVF